MHATLAPLILATEEAGADTTANANWGQLALILVALGVLAWVVYLYVASRRGVTPPPEETPKNLQPYLSDDELENTRLTRVLGAAVVASAVLAIALPVYYIGESRRQADAAEEFVHKDVEEGEHWYEAFSCINCHGPDAGGGGAEWVESRSGLGTTWSAPSLNDVYYRYSEEEVQYWIVYGRQGTPMPANGLDGGGQMTIQEVDQLMMYLDEIQISQVDALAKADGLVSQAINRLANSDVTASQLIRNQQAVIDDVLDAPDRFAVVDEIPQTIRSLMAEPGVCTDESAAVVGAVCSNPAADQDRDGLSDEFELRVAGPGNELVAAAAETVRERSVDLTQALVEFDPDGNARYEAELVPIALYAPMLYEFSLSPLNAFTMTDEAGEPMADLDALALYLTDLDTARLNLSVTTERNDRFLENAVTGYDFLVDAYAERAWVPAGVTVDSTQVVDDNGDPSVEVDFDFSGLAAAMGPAYDAADAERAVGLFNAYCARCHTAGYSAGVAYEQGAGSGAWGPALEDGRSVVQFPALEDQVSFIIKGSNQAEAYGVNGIGRGWMPGFGQLLTEEDIRLIVAFERSL